MLQKRKNKQLSEDELQVDSVSYLEVWAEVSRSMRP